MNNIHVYPITNAKTHKKHKIVCNVIGKIQVQNINENKK